MEVNSVDLNRGRLCLEILVKKYNCFKEEIYGRNLN